MEQILDFSKPLDVGLLDRVVSVMLDMSANEQERGRAHSVLTQFQEHQFAWTKVDIILEQSVNSNTKMVALKCLDEVIRFRWKALPEDQKEGIKNYIVNLIIKMSGDEETLKNEKTYLNKLNLCLVQVVKQEWPERWKSFIPNLVGSSKTSETLCQNNMEILRLLSEEVFDYSQGQMTQARIHQLKSSFNDEFSQIFELCSIVLEATSKASLLAATLETLLRFLNWIPLGYIFETKLIDSLIFRFFPVPEFRNVVLRCLNEIAALQVGQENDEAFNRLFNNIMQQLSAMGINSGTDIKQAYERGSPQEQDFVQALSMFFHGLFSHHLSVCEQAHNHKQVQTAHMILVNISKVEEIEIFKICLEYWNKLTNGLYNEQAALMGTSGSGLDVLALDSHQHTGTYTSSRAKLYNEVLHFLRGVLINRMPKPEEVLIVENDDGEIVREYVKDTDSIQLYKTMRECLIFLTHLDCEDMENVMLEKLSAIMSGSDWSWNSLNTLCWAIGSISGAQKENDEKRFLVTVIKDLLNLCEIKRGKDNKAVVAANIMYTVGQYPRFLKAHWKFLKTVVNKLFEFMHERHPGVQDMACDTFHKIVQKTKKKFVIIQVGEKAPFVNEIIEDLPQTISDLTAAQIQSFYETVGLMIDETERGQVQESLIRKLMELPNATWTAIVQIAQQDVQTLKQVDTVRDIANIVKANQRLATSLGHPYVSQLGRIFLDLLNVYKTHSSSLSDMIAQNGLRATATTDFKVMRTCKREILKLFQTWIERSNDEQMVRTQFLPPLLEAILVDYQTNVPDARDAEVLTLIAATIKKVGSVMTEDIPRIFDHIFACTLEMITKNFEDYPSIRSAFFEVIEAVDGAAFSAFFLLDPAQFKLVIDSIAWSFKHTASNIADLGLETLLSILRHVESHSPAAADSFYQSFFLSIMQDIFSVLTDTFHKSGFKLHTAVLAHMFGLIASGRISTPLFDPAMYPALQGTVAENNTRFITEFALNLLSTAFPNVAKAQLESFISMFISKCHIGVEFKGVVRDFLVQIKEFSSGDDNAILYAEEAAIASQAREQARLAIPGMANPYDATIPDTDAMA